MWIDQNCLSREIYNRLYNTDVPTFEDKLIMIWGITFQTPNIIFRCRIFFWKTCIFCIRHFNTELNEIYNSYHFTDKLSSYPNYVLSDHAKRVFGEKHLFNEMRTQVRRLLTQVHKTVEKKSCLSICISPIMWQNHTYCYMTITTYNTIQCTIE